MIRKCGRDSKIPAMMAVDALSAGVDTTGNTGIGARGAHHGSLFPCTSYVCGLSPALLHLVAYCFLLYVVYIRVCLTIFPTSYVCLLLFPSLYCYIHLFAFFPLLHSFTFFPPTFYGSLLHFFAHSSNFSQLHMSAYFSLIHFFAYFFLLRIVCLIFPT